MTITKDSAKDKFHLGAQEAVLPGGLQLANGQVVAPTFSEYDTPLSQLGKRQRLKNARVLLAHAGDVFTKPTARCQVLMNGYLKLLPNN